MNPFFVEAIDIQDHPIKKAKKKIKAEYITSLGYIVEKTIKQMNSGQIETSRFINERLRIYQSRLFKEIPMIVPTKEKEEKCLSAFNKPWRSKYQFMLICDVSLLLLEKELVNDAVAIIKEQLTTKQQNDVDQVIALLYNNQDVEKKYLVVSDLINQFRANRAFFSRRERRVIVTANMSAGKSTLINALVGKSIVRTSQEVCTGNICYLFNKPFDDGNIHLLTQELNLSVTEDDLQGYDWNDNISMATFFTGISCDVPRICVIDTPGVDAALYKEHSKRTKNELLKNNYDTIIYVVSPTRLGTEAEKNYLQWVAQNLHKGKIIFVLNKLDCYHDFSDSIEESIFNFKKELLKIGFENPIICPISAYFSYLLKLRFTGQNLSEDELDEYTLYEKKFKRTTYDLSHYYEGVHCLPTDSDEISLSKRAGLYGLEKIIYGG